LPLPIPKGQNSAALADWVEATLINGSTDALSEVRIARLLKGEASEVAEEELRAELSAFEGNGDDEETEEDIELSQLGVEAEAERDVRLELLTEEIELRAQLGQNVYPFRVRGDRVVQVDVYGENAYFFLLALSSKDAAYRHDRRTHEVEAAFDLLALEAMRRYLGHEAEGVRFSKMSSDADDSTTRPKLFSEAIEWLRNLLDLREGHKKPLDEELDRHWEWEDESDPRPALNTYQDGGVDLVVWWKFKDGRRGFPVLLVQCTVQLTWERKLGDIPIKLWEQWINFSMVPPQTALVIPFSEDPEDERWDDRSLRAGIVVDRVRLLELLDELDSAALRGLVDASTVEWAVRELKTIS
jgi:hypothetical protein